MKLNACYIRYNNFISLQFLLMVMLLLVLSNSRDKNRRIEEKDGKALRGKNIFCLDLFLLHDDDGTLEIDGVFLRFQDFIASVSCFL